jgi:NADH dehydrogenase (ubiquinone) Fe-S protein 2
MPWLQGVVTPFYGLYHERRENSMEFRERFSRARMHAAYVRPEGVPLDILLGLCEDTCYFVGHVASRTDEM